MKELEYKSGSFEVKREDGNLYIEGYAAIFGVQDSYEDVINPGAFDATLINDRKRMRFCYQHDIEKVIGKIIDIKTDSMGLWCRLRISNTDLGKDVAILIEDEALNELSIGYKTEEAVRDDMSGIRYLDRVKLVEISIVTRAANEQAVITSTEVKSEDMAKSLKVSELTNSGLQELKKNIDKEYYSRILKSL